MSVIAEGIPRGWQGETSNPRVLGMPTISLQLKLYSQRKGGKRGKKV